MKREFIAIALTLGVIFAEELMVLSDQNTLGSGTPQTDEYDKQSRTYAYCSFVP